MSSPGLHHRAASAPAWQRFTPAQRLMRYGVWLAIVAAVVQSARTVQVIPEFLADAPEQMADMLVRMWPVDWAHYPASIHEALVETLHMATLGTILSLVMAVPLGLLVAGNLTRNRLLNFIARVHLLPHAATVARAALGILFGGAVVSEAALAFVGLGDPAVVSLGQLAASGFGFVTHAPWMWAAPVVVIVVLTASVAALGDALVDQDGGA